MYKKTGVRLATDSVSPSIQCRELLQFRMQSESSSRCTCAAMRSVLDHSNGIRARRASAKGIKKPNS
eukprot:scaffold20255_cov92-Amphora_coffeaeformis.AAC.1